jgi:hypothetical protein
MARSKVNVTSIAAAGARSPLVKTAPRRTKVKDRAPSIQAVGSLT